MSIFIGDINNPINVSDEAIEVAKTLTIPNPNNRVASDKQWQAAFSWYNKYINKTGKPLAMNCIPCWSKVFQSLSQTKFKLRQIKEYEISKAKS